MLHFLPLLPCVNLLRANLSRANLSCIVLPCTALHCPVPPRTVPQVMIMELGSTHEPIIEVAKAGVLLALEHNMLPKAILQEALRWEITNRSTCAPSSSTASACSGTPVSKRPVQPMQPTV